MVSFYRFLGHIFQILVTTMQKYLGMILKQMEMHWENGYNDIVLVDRGRSWCYISFTAVGHSIWNASITWGWTATTNEDVNAFCIVTKSRWIVENRNDHFRSVFKFFANTLCLQHVKKLQWVLSYRWCNIEQVPSYDLHRRCNCTGGTRNLGEITYPKCCASKDGGRQSHKKECTMEKTES